MYEWSNVAHGNLHVYNLLLQFFVRVLVSLELAGCVSSLVYLCKILRPHYQNHAGLLEEHKKVINVLDHHHEHAFLLNQILTKKCLVACAGLVWFRRSSFWNNDF